MKFYEAMLITAAFAVFGAAVAGTFYGLFALGDYLGGEVGTWVVFSVIFFFCGSLIVYAFGKDD